MGLLSAPESWIDVSLEFLLEHVIGGDWGKNPEHDEQDYQLVACIRGSEFKRWASENGRTAVDRKVKDSSLEKRALRPGDILLEISGGGPEQPVGRTVLIDESVLSQFETPVIGTNFLRLLRPFKELDQVFLSRYLEFFYKSGEVVRYQGGSNNLRNLKFKEYSKIDVPIPPLAEQKVIAEKLDTLLAQVESTKARLERIPKILKRFRQSVLAAAVSGKLTEEWRDIRDGDESAERLFVRWNENREKRFNDKQEELLRLGKIKRKKNSKAPLEPDLETSPPQEIPKDWKMVSVSQFAECLDSQRVPVKKEDRITAQGIYPYFGANGEVDRVDDYIFDGDFVLVTEDETFYGREKPIAYRYTGKCWVNNHAHVLQAESKEANDYLCFSLMHYHILPWLSGTTGRAKLTQAALNSLPIGMPPEDELTEIVRRVDQLFAYADTIEIQVNNALERVNNLTQSILAKAFRGELTEQWRKDNPDLISGENSAEALLDKIKAERAAAKPVKRGRKKA